MSAFYELPRTLTVDGVEYPIRTDYRAVLQAISQTHNQDLSPIEKADWMCFVLYKDWDSIPNQQEAMEQACRFIDCGRDWKGKSKAPRVMDWEKDWNMIAPACSRVAGRSIREMPYLHWWDFIGLYQEIGECSFSTVVAIRHKIARGKKLEKWEQDYKREHPELFNLNSIGEDLIDLLEQIRGGESL